MRASRVVAGAAILVAAVALQLLGANPAVSQSPELVAWAAGDPGLDPEAAIWRDIPPLEVPLSAQGMTYPMSMRSIPMLRVRAIVNRGVLYMRVDWDDQTRDDTSARVDAFADAVAIELPSNAASSVPSVCMGQADTGVSIWQWRADSERDVQAAVADAFPGGYVDVAPGLGDLSFPARAVGNPYAASGAGPVQDLVATGFGTLGPAAVQTVRGRGAWQGSGWAVVFARPLAAPGPDQPTLRLHDVSDLALAVWDGSQGDRNGKKSVSSFVRLVLSGAAFPPIRVNQQNPPPIIWVLAVAPFAAFALFGAVALGRSLRRPR